MYLSEKFVRVGVTCLKHMVTLEYSGISLCPVYKVARSLIFQSLIPVAIHFYALNQIKRNNIW